MGSKSDGEDSKSRRRLVEGLPNIRPHVAGADLASERHWVCAPTVDGAGREVADFGGTTGELLRLAAWLKERRVESVAMESTGVYWIAPHEVLEAQGFEVCWWTRGSWRGFLAGTRRAIRWTASGFNGCTVADS